MTDNPRAFKHLIDRAAVRSYAEAIAATGRPFRRALFTRRATAGLEDLELKDRVRQVAAALRDALDPDVPTALETLCAALPEALPDSEAVSQHMIWWPFLQFAESYATEEERHWQPTMHALQRMTKTFSAEFAIRPLLDRWPERTLERLLQWAQDPDEHVRRLCSEGSRPRLPWGLRLQGFIDDPHATMPILDALIDDPEEYVRRSVANHVNDIAKDSPEVALELTARWAREPAERSGSKNRQRLIRHALRSLIKQGHPDALAQIGYGRVRLDAGLSLSGDEAALGEPLTLSVELRSRAAKDQPLLVDYAVHFPGRDGTLRPKVFKWTETTLPARNRLTLERRHTFRRVTTRTHRPGLHRIEILINGRSVAIEDVVVGD